MKSMTGYANVYKTKNKQTIQLIIRSSNFRHLDICIHNLPIKNIFLEEKIRTQIKKVIARGRVEVYLFFKKIAKNSLYIQEDILKEYINISNMISKKYHLDSKIGVQDILNLPHLVIWDEAIKEEGLIISALKDALKQLIEFKIKEGAAIKKTILNNLTLLEENVKKMKKLRKTVVKQSCSQTDESNVNKGDIEEEISLIAFYISKIKRAIEDKGNFCLGKSLDFLCQEILRELNAASSKTKHKYLGGLIVDCKSYLERIREQSQNIE